ncbi:MAG: hypothetical protein ACK40K_02405 [Raineya sp.]
MFAKTLFLLCSSVFLMTCSNIKKNNSRNQSEESLYQKWQLESVESISSASKLTDYKSKNLFVTFTKDGRIDFNLDVNSCSGTFKEGANQTLVFNNTDFKCTQACCDSIKLNYHEVKKYKIEKNTLTLYSDTETFYFKLAQ